MTTVIIDTDKWITAREAGELAGVTPGRIRQLALAGEIDRLKLSDQMCWYGKQSVMRWANRERPQTGRPRISDV